MWLVIVLVGLPRRQSRPQVVQSLAHERYKLRRSIVVTFNRIFQNWGIYLGDNTMASSILNGLMHHTAMLEFDRKSYRLKETAGLLAKETALDS